MSEPNFPWFTKPCLEAFHFLVERYGFAEPVLEQLGREQFIRYQCGNRSVSIAYEPGSHPCVELFFPTHEIKNRRFPRGKMQGHDPKKFNDRSESDMASYLKGAAASLEQNEKLFLEGKSEP